MRMLIGGIFVGALAMLVVIEILVCLRADSRRERMMISQSLDKVFVWGPEGGQPRFSNNRNRFTFLYGAAAIEDETAPGGLVYVMFDRTFDGCRELFRKQLAYLEKHEIPYTVSKLLFGDYMDYNRPGAVGERGEKNR